MNPIALRLQESIENKGNMSVRRLEELTGIPKSAIQRYITGTTDRIPIDRLKLLAGALSVTPAYLMGIETKEGEPINSAINDQVNDVVRIAEQLSPENLQLATEFLAMLLRKQ